MRQTSRPARPRQHTATEGVDACGHRSSRIGADGSVDIYFGPTAPVDKERNWIYTEPGKLWFTFFRLYGPEKAVFEKTWA
ncbi:MAG TPA: DUF1214 domain-containing protein, partial [Candidatus Tectomicrobia bacterium]